MVTCRKTEPALARAHRSRGGLQAYEQPIVDGANMAEHHDQIKPPRSCAVFVSAADRHAPVFLRAHASTASAPNRTRRPNLVTGGHVPSRTHRSSVRTVFPCRRLPERARPHLIRGQAPDLMLQQKQTIRICASRRCLGAAVRWRRRRLHGNFWCLIGDHGPSEGAKYNAGYPASPPEERRSGGRKTQ